MDFREVKILKLEDIYKNWDVKAENLDENNEYTKMVYSIKKKISEEIDSSDAKMKVISGIEVPDSKTLVAVLAAIHLLKEQGSVTVYVPDAPEERGCFIKF